MKVKKYVCIILVFILMRCPLVFCQDAVKAVLLYNKSDVLRISQLTTCNIIASINELKQQLIVRLHDSIRMESMTIGPTEADRSISIDKCFNAFKKARYVASLTIVDRKGFLYFYVKVFKRGDMNTFRRLPTGVFSFQINQVALKKWSQLIGDHIAQLLQYSSFKDNIGVSEQFKPFDNDNGYKCAAELADMLNSSQDLIKYYYVSLIEMTEVDDIRKIERTITGECKDNFLNLSIYKPPLRKPITKKVNIDSDFKILEESLDILSVIK